jgi:hypothetical protein
MIELKKKWLLMTTWAIFVLISQKVHIGFGGHACSFTCCSVILPLIGSFFSFPITSALYMAMWLAIHIHATLPMTMGIPTLFAALSWQASRSPNSVGHFLLHLFLPLLCMILFYLSPVGEKAWPYSLYWCIPVALYLLSFSYAPLLIQRALLSTFVAHAIGSVIWVYCVPMSSEQWLALIPVVATERLLMAFLSVPLCMLLQMLDKEHVLKDLRTDIEERLPKTKSTI